MPDEGTGGVSSTGAPPAQPPLDSASLKQVVEGERQVALGQARLDPAAALSVLEQTYGTLNAPLLARVDALVSRHLMVTSPEVVTVTLGNGHKRRYLREITTRKDTVKPRQARRRLVQAEEAVSKILRVDAGMASAVLEDMCRRARTSGGVAVAPSAAVAALPRRLQSQFFADNNISAATFQRFRMLLGPKCGLASPLALRKDLMRAAVEESNQATTNGQGAFLVSPRAALEALIFNLRRQGQFLERAVRGADGRELVASRAFEGQKTASIPPASCVKDVHICFGLDKGGLISSCKAVLSCANQLHPSSRGNSILYGIFPCQKDDHAALTQMADVYVPDLDSIRTSGL